MRVQKCKGTRDLAPAQMEQFRLVESVFRDSCLKWGYREVRTPTLEYLHLFTSTGTLTPATLGKVYSFLDWDGWSGERVVLRPDGTIPVARMYIDNYNDTAFARFFYVTNIFIFEQTGKENRERWQCGTEIIGVSSPAADVELITLAMETLRNLGLNGRVKLSHAGIIRALLSGFGLSPEEQGKAFDSVLDGDTAFISRLKIQKPEMIDLLRPLLEMKGTNAGFLKNLKAVFTRQMPEFLPVLENFIGITELLSALGQEYEIDIASGTGFEYYTGLIFQLYVKENKVGGGGRYDALIPLLGGNDIPASGFALYVDPIMELIKQYASDEADGVYVSVKTQDIDTVQKAFELIKRLHTVGLKASLTMDKQPPAAGWQVQVADTSPVYTLTDVNAKTITAETIEELLKLMGGAR